MTTDNGAWDSRYDTFIEEAERDDRIGKHVAIVTGPTVEKEWEGKKIVEIPVSLTTARNAPLTLGVFDKTPADVLATLPPDVRSREGMGLKFFHKPLATHYGLRDFRQLQQGQKIGVVVGQDRKYFKKTGKNWPKIVGLIPLAEAEAAQTDGAPAEAKVEEVPF